MTKRPFRTTLTVDPAAGLAALTEAASSSPRTMKGRFREAFKQATQVYGSKER